MNAGTRNALMIAGVLGVVGAVVVAGLMTRTGGGGSTPDLLADRPGPAARPAAPVDAPGGAGGGGGGRTGISDLVQAGSKARVVSTDSAGNPVLELAFDTIEPLPDGRFAATGIDGWWRLGEQRVQVEAPAGTLVMPAASQAPESGTLSGGVTIRVLAPDQAGGGMGVQASVAIDALAFDLSTGELSTEDTVNARGRGWAADLEGLFVQFSEVRQRIQYARVVRGGAVRIGDEHGLASGPGEAEGPAGARAAQGSAAARADEPARVDHYRIEIADRVRLDNESRSIESDVLQVFARLTDGSLAGVDDAGRGDGGRSRERDESDDARGPGLEASLAWAGVMELRAVDESPTELVRDELVARFMPMDRARVMLADSASGVRAEAAGFEYAATRRAARLIGVPNERAVVVEAPGVGRAALSDLLVDFATGRGSATGPGELLAERAAGDRAPERIGWETGLTFQLGGVAAGSSDAIWLERADFTGGVVASDGARRLRGHLVRAWFDRLGAVAAAGGGSEDQRAGMRLQRVTATGDGDTLAEAVSPRADAGTGEASAEAFDRIAAMELTVLFEPTGVGSAVSPRLASAVGQVRGVWDGNTVEGGYAEASFAERANADGSDAVAVDRVMIESADGEEVVLVSADGWRAAGRRATAVDGGRSATIVGSPASVVFMDDAGGQALTGPSIELRQESQTVAVNGPGTASLATLGELATAYSRVQVSWSDALVYDDRAGRAEAVGGVVAVGSWPPDAEGRSERHIGEGQRAVLRITPGSSDGAGDAPAMGGGERRLLAVELSGDAESVAEADWARVETRRFVEPGAGDAGERRLELLVELAGRVLRSDMQEGTLDVPGAGRLVIEDRRRNAGDAVGSVGTLSRFRWAGGLALDADAGRSVMTDGVSLLHRPAGATANTEMRCQRLEAWFVDEQGRRLGESSAVGAAGDLVQGLGAAGVRLERVELRGAVWISHEALEVSGDALRYRTSDEELFITANDGNTVTVVERASGRTFNAREVAVNLRTGAWRRSGGGTVR